MSLLISNFMRNLSTKCNESESPKQLFRYLLRQCNKLPQGAKEHYKFQVKQSFKQHIREADPERIKQIIQRSYKDAEWVLKKYIGSRS